MQLDRARALEALRKAKDAFRSYMNGTLADRDARSFLDQYFEGKQTLAARYMAAMQNAEASLESVDLHAMDSLGSGIARAADSTARAYSFPHSNDIHLLTGDGPHSYFNLPTRERVTTLIHEAVHEGGVWGHKHGGGSVDPYLVESIVKKANGWKLAP